MGNTLEMRAHPKLMVLLEYMTAGRPIVATNVGSVADVVHHELHGLLVDQENSQQLASAISRVLDDPESAARRAANARALVAQRFTIQHTVSNTQSLLTDTLRARRGLR